jgi:hypothetical protein
MYQSGRFEREEQARNPYGRHILNGVPSVGLDRATLKSLQDYKFAGLKRALCFLIQDDINHLNVYEQNELDRTPLTQ